MPPRNLHQLLSLLLASLRERITPRSALERRKARALERRAELEQLELQLLDAQGEERVRLLEQLARLTDGLAVWS